MKLKSALEDVVGTTLPTLPGVLAQMAYLADLRRAGQGRSYAHWGLRRVYGDRAAEAALADAHRFLLLKVLRTSVRELLEDAQNCSRAQAISAVDYLGELLAHRKELLPEDLGGGSERHFNSVLEALSALLKHPPCSILPA